MEPGAAAGAVVVTFPPFYVAPNETYTPPLVVSVMEAGRYPPKTAAGPGRLAALKPHRKTEAMAKTPTVTTTRKKIGWSSASRIGAPPRIASLYFKC